MTEQQQLAEARELLRTGRYDAALARLEGCEEWTPPLDTQGILVRAEVRLRRDPIDALETIARLSHSFTTPEARIDYYIFSGKAYANGGNFDAAFRMLAEAAELARAFPQRVPEIAHHRARARYLQGTFRTDDPDFAIALSSPDPAARMMTLIVRSWVYAGAGDYDAQIADLLAALALGRAHFDAVDFFSLARGVHSLAQIGFERGDAEAVGDAEGLYEQIAWTPDLQAIQFLCLRVFAWNAFLHGNSARAQWLFRDSKELAPTDAWKIMAHLDRAYVARINRNEPWALEELAQAQELARSVPWAELAGEERQILVTLANLLAPVDMARAQRYVSTYIKLGTQSIDPTLAVAHDRRATGFAQYALGRVHQVLGNTAAATAAFEEAYAIFDAAGHPFRAALAAQGMAELTNSPRWVERSREHAGHFPKSAFFEFLTQSVTREREASLEELTPMQRQLAHALCAGLELPALSKRFSRSEFTMKREVRSLYERLGVSSRRALRDFMEARGLL